MTSNNDNKGNQFNKQRRNFIKASSAAAFAAFAANSLSVSAKTLTSEPQARHFLSQQEQGDFSSILKPFIGTWNNEHLVGRGYNMIALPFSGDDRLKYRLLLNRYNETLQFKAVDDNIPNRGLPNDQFLSAIEYHQDIIQTDAADFPISNSKGGANLDIHHESGKLLHMKNNVLISPDKPLFLMVIQCSH